MALTDSDRNVYMVIINLDKTIKELMLQRDVLAAMLPQVKKSRNVKVITLKELRSKR